MFCKRTLSVQIYILSSSDIKKAYRKMVILYHPDKIQHLDDAFKKSAKDKFFKINEAYDYLKIILNFK